MFPKPKNSKHRAKNNPRPTYEDVCIICGNHYAHLHEVYGGKNRQNSIKHNLQVRLCFDHHIGERGIHSNITFDIAIKQQTQREFELTHSREEFFSIIGKNYL